ncbi:MAG TPA: alpha-amylase family glycosyl hydrolase [Longimicrobiaceae bacterium]|nr:alpha-amylase family glycosyl hydrolase [Longimicrobiaceae bacterium]
MKDHYLWWQRGIVYQVYPRSFQDSDGDGVGDLPGITSRLDYLRWLGVDAVWISPIYPSPMADFGYDVSDYCGIHPMFGTMADFDRLVEEAHARGLKVILDFVPNHSSDQHPWFAESRRSRDNPKRDWYIWRDPAPDGGPPNNWLSNFGGPAWTFDEATGQYYYHAFLKEQPDLNWRNPQVVRAMLEVLRFWLERGVDGFRVDVIWHLIKDPEFRDNPPDPTWTPDQRPYDALLKVHSTDQPEVHDVIGEMRRLFDEYHERVLIGEIYLPVERLVRYYGEDMSGVHLPFNFQLILARWDARHLAGLIDEYEAALPEGGWPNWVLGNHDQHRIASRVGAAQARVAAMLLLTLRGTPTLYYGDEIGMHDVEIPPDRVQDPFEKNVPGKGLGRDPERTPMQWDAGPNAGFTTGDPWLPIAEDHRVVNVEAERDAPRSTLSLYRRLIDLRRGEPALEVGRFEPVAADGDVLAYIRRARRGEGDFLVALNLGSRPHVLGRPADAQAGVVAVSTHLDREGERVRGDVELRPDEGVVIRLTRARHRRW